MRKIFDQFLVVERCGLTFVLNMVEYSEQSFLAVNDVLWSGKSGAGEQRAFCAHATGPRIDRVLHVGELSGSHCSRTKRARRANADGRDHLIASEIQDAAGCDRRCERAQRRMMPAI